MNFTKVSQEKIEQFVTLFNQGVKIDEICEILKVGRTTLNRYKNKLNLSRENNYDYLKKLTDEQEKEIIKLYESGTKTGQLMKIYNVGRALIIKILKKHNQNIGISYHSKEYVNKHLEDITKLFKEGLSQTKIAKQLNIPQVTVSRILRKHVPEYKSKFVKCGRWNGGKIIDNNGYVRLWISEDDKFYCMSDSVGYVLEHRYVMANHLGRPLTKEESVHHKNGVKDDNRIDNLQLRKGQHGKGQCYKCSDCGSINIIETDI